MTERLTDIERIIAEKEYWQKERAESWDAFTRHMEMGELREYKQSCIDEDIIIDALKEYMRFKDLEEQGRLVELPAENDFKRDELDRCIHRHCNKCDGYRKEIERYKALQEQGRLIELPEGINRQRFLQPLIDKCCPGFVGLHDKGDCRGIDCKECWEEALKGGAE